LTADSEEKLIENGVSTTKETMGLMDEEVIEGFNTLMGETNLDTMTTPGQQLSTFIVSGVNDKKKMKVMDSTIKVLANIPTNFDVPTIKQMIEYFGMIYQTAPNLGIFYQNVASSTKIKESPYNSKYAQLILFLIGKFNNDVENCIEKPSENCGFLREPFNPKKSDIVPEYLQEPVQKNNLAQEIRNELISRKSDNESSCSSCSNNVAPYKMHSSAKPGYIGEMPNRGLLPAKPFAMTDYTAKPEPEQCFNKCDVQCPVSKPEGFGIIEPQDNSMNYYSSFH
jgi:hypothetical protein